MIHRRASAHFPLRVGDDEEAKCDSVLLPFFFPSTGGLPSPDPQGR